MLKIEGLNAAYGSIQVLKNISLKVPKGKVVSIIGANGAGKSTLLKSISGLMKISKGNIFYKNKDIAGMPASRIVGLGISQVPEGRQIFAHLSVLDNIHLGAYLYFKRNNRFEIKERVNRIYEIFPILETRSRTADAGHCPCFDGPTGIASFGRALHGHRAIDRSRNI